MKVVRRFGIVAIAGFSYIMLFHYIGDFTMQQSGALGIAFAILSAGVRDALKKSRPEPPR